MKSTALVPDMFGVWCASRTLCWAVGGSVVAADTVSTMAIMMSTVVRGTDPPANLAVCSVAFSENDAQ